MFTLKVENTKGSVLELTGKEDRYQIMEIAGLDQPAAQINSIEIAGLDGKKVTNTKLDVRNIVLYIALNGDVEKNRQTLYRYFYSKKSCKLYFANENRDVYIEGIVESFDCGLFDQKEIAVISIICPDPYFKSTVETATDISNTLAGFSFPFSINIGDPIPFSVYEGARITNVYNATEAETGVIIEIVVETDDVQDIEIKNIQNGQYIKLHYAFETNDRIRINTNKGQKSVLLYRAGEVFNIFPAMQRRSTMFELEDGDNLFGYVVDEGEHDDNVFITFIFDVKYIGV